jgi:transcriptional regulator with PAS, ATPase and Fis domain
MLKLLDTARQVATTGCNVLLLGESGTGKELFARFIHEQSQRRDKPLVAVNCGAFGEELLVNELFGHEKGAFTGANASKPGLMETAHTGTLFLDEITEMSLTMQVKLVRVIQEREVLRLGSTRPIHVDVRFIAASNRTIEDVLASGEFREDLYYRLNVVTFTMPPLSDRKGDIPVLCEYFLAKHAVLMGKDPPTLSDEVLAILKKHDFPGNVRELENIIQRGVALARGNAIEIKHLPEDLQHNPVATPAKPASGRRPTLEEQEVRYIRQVLEEANGNRTLAAQVLGIDRVSLWRKIKKYELE